MSQQTHLKVNVTDKSTNVTDEIDQIKQIKQTNQIYVNIVLESSTIIGFIIIRGNDHDKSLTLLSNIRKCINSQFDDDQLHFLGNDDTFKFLRNSIPISNKQENLINVSEISISAEKHSKHSKNSKKHMKHSKQKNKIDISDDDDDDDDDDTKDVTDDDDDDDEDDDNNNNTSLLLTKQNSLNPNYEIIPHHYQYINYPPPSHLVPSTPSTTAVTNTINATNKSKRIQINTNATDNHYSIVVRTRTRMPMHMGTNVNGADDEQSIFGKFEDQNFETLDYNNTIRRSSKKSILFHKQIDFELTTISDNMNNNNNNNNNNSNNNDVLDTPRSPNDKTQLEVQFGGKLPKIRANRSTTELMTNSEISSILANAVIKDKTTAALELTPVSEGTNTNTWYTSNNNNNNNNGNRFTVIGSPSLTDDLTTQRIWMFSEATQLILGLQGVHHSTDNPVWMDLVCDADTFIMISEHVRPSIHGLTIEDCITRECREKLEMFDNYLFCCIRVTSIANEEQSEKICIVIFKTMILTYHSGGTSDIIISETKERLERRHGGIKCSSPGWVAHTIIDVIVDRMIPEVECRVQEVQNIENLVFGLSGTSQYELLQRLQIARNWLMVYRSRLWPKSTMTHNFINTDWRETFLSGVQQQYWNDINDHVARMVDLLSLGQSTLESCQNIFIAKISLEMADQSNQLSDSAGRLTAVGSIFLPLSFFAGLWGMNCKVPFQYDNDDSYWGNTYYGFTIVFLLMICAAIVTYKYAMKFT